MPQEGIYLDLAGILYCNAGHTATPTLWCCTLSTPLIEKWRNDLRKLLAGTESVLTNESEIYFIDASFHQIADPVEQAKVMTIPTALYLTQEQIEDLLSAASRLIRRDPELQRLLADLKRNHADHVAMFSARILRKAVPRAMPLRQRQSHLL